MSENTLTRESLVSLFGEDDFKKACQHEAGHVVIAYLFKRPLDYVKMTDDKAHPGVMHMTGSELDGSAHIAIGGHIAEFLIRKNFNCDLNTVMTELPAELYKSDPDYQSFQAACYYFKLAETNVVEQCFNVLMVCQKQVLAIASALNEKLYLNRTDLDTIMQTVSK